MLVQRGMTGGDVIAVQTALRNLGWNNVNIDGVFGPITQQAVLDYQYLSGLSTTGIVDDATWGAMQQDLGATIVSATSTGGNYTPILPVVTFRPSVVTQTQVPVVATGQPQTQTQIPIVTPSSGLSTPMMIGIGLLGVTLLLIASKNKYI